MKPRMMSESRQSAPISSRLGTLRGAPRGDSGDPGSAMEEWTVGSGPARLPLPPQPPRPRAPWPRARRRRVPQGAGSPPSPQPSAARAPQPCACSAPRARALQPRPPAPTAPPQPGRRAGHADPCGEWCVSQNRVTKTLPGPHLTAFRAPRLQNLIRRALAPDRSSVTKFGSWKPPQIRGFFPASLCSVLGVLGSEPQKTSRQMTLCSPSCPAPRHPCLGRCLGTLSPPKPWPGMGSRLLGRESVMGRGRVA